MDSMNTSTAPASEPSAQMPQAPEPKQGSSAATLIGAAIVIIALALGAYYFFMNDALAPTTGDQATVENGADQKTEALRQTSSSDETGAIEGDLQATDLGNMEAEMNATAGTI